MIAGPHVVVAVPARDEEQRIGAALDALRRSAEVLAERHPGATVTVVVAADACTDRTAAIAADAGAIVVETTAGRVGAARAVAVRRALDERPDAVWIACTDADSAVPPGWLSMHLAAAHDGVGLLLGAVRPDERDLPDALLRRWEQLNPAGEDHRYVHGANLGIAPAVYAQVGGFPDVDQDEDVLLAVRCRATGAEVRSTGAEPVLTSARREGRVPGGFSGYLRGIEDGGSVRV